jgi:hypothetical protein
MMSDLTAQRDVIKRILKYVRRNATIYQKEHLRAVEEKYGQAVRSFSDGMAQAYQELVGYMEGLLREFDEAVDAQPIVDEGEDSE